MHNNQVVIGWIGSQSTFKYLLLVKDVLKQLIAKYNVLVYIVGAKESLELGENEVHIDWAESTEIKSIQQFDIGIMPLSDTPWEQGKCAYKLIQYMGCGLPVVASAVGMNKEVVKNGYSGFWAKTEKDWYDYLEKYITDSNLRKEHGKTGAKIVAENYSLDATLPKILQIIQKT
jgi:glycosyltransferase involved in cell wall biosynthesis